MRKKALTVSIVIPVYNEQGYLKACLDAISKQSEQPLEVLVVDNNSTDNSVKIAKEFDFVTVLSEKTQGVVAARNHGFNAARGDIIARIDADTIIPKNWVKEVQRSFGGPSIGAVTGPTGWYDMPGAPRNYLAEHTFKQFLYTYTPHHPFLLGANMAIRRVIWECVADACCNHAGPYFEDIDLAIHIVEAGYECAYVKKVRALVSSRRLDNRLSEFMEYMSCFKNTYQAHDLHGMMPYVASSAYMLSYFALYPLRRSYDHQTGKRSLKHLVFGYNEARRNPM